MYFSRASPRDEPLAAVRRSTYFFNILNMPPYFHWARRSFNFESTTRFIDERPTYGRLLLFVRRTPPRVVFSVPSIIYVTVDWSFDIWIDLNRLFKHIALSISFSYVIMVLKRLVFKIN